MRFAIRNLLTEAGYGPDTGVKALSLRDRVIARWSGTADERLSADLAFVRDEPWFGLASLPDPEELTDYAFEFDFDRRGHSPSPVQNGMT